MAIQLSPHVVFLFFMELRKASCQAFQSFKFYSIFKVMKVCKTCVMDSETDPDLILVNDKCNHCIRYENQFNSRVDTDEKALGNY